MKWFKLRNLEYKKFKIETLLFLKIRKFLNCLNFQKLLFFGKENLEIVFLGSIGVK